MKQAILVILFFRVAPVLSQNLVPNPGFDDLTLCPTAFGQINLAPPWVSANNGSPDLYNICSTSSGIRVPNSGHYFDSYQKQRSKTGYAGIFVYNNSNLVVYEYIETILDSHLVEGKTYYIEFYVSPDLTPITTWRYTDAIGLALSDTFYYKELTSHEAIPLVPVVENRGALIRDTIGWTRISGCYSARGGEKYAIIGNFRNDSETLIEVEDPNQYPYINYFYVEDVFISAFDPFPDTIFICKNQVVNLNANFLDATYMWNTNESDSVILVQSPGIYSVQAFMSNCILTDTVVVFNLEDPDYFPSDTIICQAEQFVLTSPMIGDYLWSDGSMGSSIIIPSSGTFEIKITNKCGEFSFASIVTLEECDCSFLIPNVFSPDENGVNDILQVNFTCDFEYQVLSFNVFNRWGCNVYTTKQSEEIYWNGTFRDEYVENGVYVWILEYEVDRNGEKERFLKSGDLTVLR